MSFCGNDGGAIRLSDAAGVPMERGVSVMVWEIWVAVLSMPARCGSIAWQEMRNRTTPLVVVVGSAGSFQPGLIDQPTRPVGGPGVVRLERIVFGVILGAAVLQSRTARRTIALPSWLVPLGRSCRAGWVLSGTGPGGVRSLRRTCS